MTRRWGLTAVVFVVVVCPLASADGLDTRLNAFMPTLMDRLRDKKIRNIGVLPFRVQTGKQVSFTSPICSRLPDRMETLLILHGGPNEDEAPRIIKDAGATAAAAGIGDWYADPEQRRNLFRQVYPMAWGDLKIRPDVFLTGVIQLEKEGRQTTLTLEMLDRRNLKLVAFEPLTLPTDRFVLRDLGYSLALGKKERSALVARRSTSPEEEDEAMFGKRPLPAVGKVRPDDLAGVSVEMLVDGTAAGMQEARDENDPIAWSVVSPAPGENVIFRLTNKADQKRAVVLRLNGLNVIDEQKEDAENCMKIVLAPGATREIKGFYLFTSKGGATDKPSAEIAPFKISVGEEAARRKAQLGPTAGLIDVDVYEEGNAEGTPGVNPRGLPPSKEQEAKASYLGLRSALLKNAKLKTREVEEKLADKRVVKREVIEADRTRLTPAKGVTVVNFARPRLMAHVTVRILPRK